MHLSLCLLGSPHLKLDDQIVEVDRRKAIALAAYLALASGARTRESLAALFWPRLDQKRSRAALRRTLAALKSAIGPDWLLIERDSLALESRDELWIDVERFESLLVQCQIHNHRGDQVCQECLNPLSQAIELYRDDFMAGFTLRDSPGFDDWQLFQREALRRKLNYALERVINCHIASKQFEQAISYAQRWLALEPLHEPAHRQMMQLYTWVNQLSAALRQYRECVCLLKSELGMEPQPATTQLFQAIQNNQLSDPQLSPHFWPISSQTQGLPIQPTPFLGRESERADIARFFLDPDRRLLTLVGPGGVGKTRLAIKAAAENAQLFRHGVAHVPLASLNSTDQVVSAIADSLGFTFQSGTEPRFQLINHLRERQVLLVLDNFEHLLASTPFVTELLGNTSRPKILVTSREQLNLRWEWLLEIQGLEYPADEGDLSSETYSAIQLYQQSAKRVRPSFALSAENLPSVARICRFLEGLPLGIELAANWSQTLSSQEIAREIQRDLDFLSTTMHDVPERHRSLRTIFDHSWDLLEPREKEAFRRLGVFRGGFHRIAAERIAGATLPLLANWARKSLLRRNPNGRYELQDVLRQYVREKLAEAPIERDQAHNRHCRYFGNFLNEHEPHLKGHQQLEALGEIGIEIENVRAAWKWAVDHQMTKEIGESLESLQRFYEMRGWTEEAEEACRTAVENMGGFGDGAKGLSREQGVTLARILAWWGRSKQLCSRMGDAQQLLDESLHLLRRLDARPEMAFPLKELGTVAWKRANIGEAEQYLDESLVIYRENGDQWGAAGTLDSLGIVACEERDYARAQKLFQQGSDICQEIGDQWGVAARITNLGIATEALGQFEEAISFHQRGVRICREVGHQRELANNLNNLAYTQLALGQDQKAHDSFREALDVALDFQRVSAALEALLGMVMLLRKQGFDDKASALLEQTLHHPVTRWEIMNASDDILVELDVQLDTHTLSDRSLYDDLAERIKAIRAQGGGNTPSQPLPSSSIYWR